MHGSDKNSAPDYTPLVAKPGREVVIDLEAAGCSWDIGGGYKPLNAWLYNGTAPGPTIEARRGDTLVVRFMNRLSEPTTLHWHGVRLQPAMDGTDAVQKVVLPGETFAYRFALPDAGTFWYHPHVNETVQIERGLYGVLVVRGPGEPQVDGEQILVLSDVHLDRDGRLAESVGSARRGGSNANVVLLNGRVNPEFTMAAGQVQRWRLVNAASGRYIRLALGDASFRIIGTDGGLIESPLRASEVLLAPGDRVELLVGPFGEGDDVEVRSLSENRAPLVLGCLHVGPRADSITRVSERLRTIEPVAPPGAKAMREVRLGDPASLGRGTAYTVNDEPYHHASPVRVGELQVWDIVNETAFDHPFHLHGFFFQVLGVNGAPPAYRSWEDTVNVPPRGRVKIAWMPDDRPGPWMAHCHILGHHAAGMMMHFDVVR